MSDFGRFVIDAIKHQYHDTILPLTAPAILIYRKRVFNWDIFLTIIVWRSIPPVL